MFFVLLTRLTSEAPVLLSLTAKNHYLFLDIGLWHLTTEFNTLNDSSADELKCAVGEKPWALLNGDRIPHAEVLTEGYLFWPVLFAPPDTGCYDAWLRQREPLVLVMEPMKPCEILKW